MKIMFVCTGNTCRSPMAEYMLRDYCNKNKLNVVVESRGIDCGNGYPIAENARLALQELGIDASKHTSKCFDLKDLSESDLVIAMTKNHKDLLEYYFGKKEKFKTFDEISGIGNIADPFGFNLDVYRFCRDTLAKAIEILGEQLKKNENK